jgi:hypothetical protein
MARSVAAAFAGRAGNLCVQIFLRGLVCIWTSFVVGAIANGSRAGTMLSRFKDETGSG